jgi:hypothetical protein
MCVQFRLPKEEELSLFVSSANNIHMECITMPGEAELYIVSREEVLMQNHEGLYL